MRKKSLGLDTVFFTSERKCLVLGFGERSPEATGHRNTTQGI